MTSLHPDELVALGAVAGAQVLVVCLSMVIANAYRERALLVHGAAAAMGVLALQLRVGGQALLAESAMLLVLAVAGLQLLDLVSHVGALRQPRRWLIAVNAGLLPGLALLGGLTQWHLLPEGLAAWLAVVTVVMLRAWPQSQPWAAWLVAGLLALVGAAGWLVWQVIDKDVVEVLPLGALLAFWSAMGYLATIWRSRISSETRVRLQARKTVDPLTGLSTPLVLHERLQSARNMSKRYGHASVLLLVHIENIGALAQEFGPEVAEAAVLLAANRIRQAMAEGDVAARLSHSRIGVLVEGASVSDSTGGIASRILVAGLREPLPTAPSEFLHFRIVMAAVPAQDVSAKVFVQRLAGRMDEQLAAPSERRIHVMAAEELRA